MLFKFYLSNLLSFNILSKLDPKNFCTNISEIDLA